MWPGLVKKDKMPSSSAPNSPRTWTSNNHAASGKWVAVFWLCVCLLIALIALVWAVWVNRDPRTFYVSMVIKDYGDLLPKPYYPEWSGKNILRLQEERQLLPWYLLESENIQSVDNLERALNELPTKLKKQECQAQDTLILQLRLHCKVTQGDKGQLDVGLLAGEKGGILSGEAFLQALQQVDAKNVVVLADIGDLDYAPQIGLPVNPIASGLRQLCERTKAKGPNIWIISATRDLDTNYVSHLRERTLLQSACEFALHKESDSDSKPAPQTISLAEFYQRVWRYCCRATEVHAADQSEPGPPEQLPVLFFVGDAKPCEPSVTDRWDLASQVYIARIDSNAKAPEQKKEKDKEAAPKTADKETSTSLADKSTEPPDPVLDYWKLRDELEEVAVWHPALFAPHYWQEHQQHMAWRQFDARANELSKEASKQLQSLLAEVQSSTAGSADDRSQLLLKSFRSFLQDPEYAVARRTWQEKEISPGDSWESMKRKYREYAAACATAPAWASWIRRDLSHANQFTDFAYNLVELRLALPKGNKGVLDESVTSFDAAKLQGAIAKLRDGLKEEAEQLSGVFSKKKQLTWYQEQRLQRLIQFPLLGRMERETLWRNWLKLKNSDNPLDHVTEADKSYQQIDNSKPVVADMGSFNDALKTWAASVGKLGQLAEVDGQNLQVQWSQASGMNWTQFGQAIYQRGSAGMPRQSERLHEWHVRCLAGLLSEPSDYGSKATFSAGIVMPASLLHTLEVARVPAGDIVQFGDKPEADLTLRASYRDSSPLSEVWVSWNLQVPAKVDPDKYLVVSQGTDSSPLDQDPRLVKLNNGLMTLKLKSMSSAQSLKSALKLVLSVRENKNGPGKDLLFSVVPQQPNRVELVVQPVVGKQVTPVDKITEDDNQAWFHTLDCVAAKGASSRYRFSLVNHSSQPKRCKVSVYALPNEELQNGPLPPERLRDLRKKMPGVGEDKLVELPAGELGKDRSVELQLESVPPSASPLPDNPELGWLYFHVQEIDAEGKELAQSHAAYCRLEGINPVLANLLTITPFRTTQGFKLTIEPNEDVWKRLGLESLEVLTDFVTGDNKKKRNSIPINVAKGRPGEISQQLESSDEVLYFYLTVGGYPRATAYVSNDDRPISPSMSEIKSVKAFTARPELPAITADNGVFPASDAQAQIITYAGIRLSAQIDLRDYSIQLINSVGQPLKTLRGKTRRLDFQWELDAGDLQLEAAAGDIEETIRLDNLDGKYALEIKHQDGRVLSKAPWYLTFDHEKPESIEFQDARGRKRDEMEVSSPNPFVFVVRAQDAGAAGIKTLNVAIDSADGEPGKYDELDIKITSVDRTGPESWQCTVPADLYKKDSGSFTVVARIEDYARNVEKPQRTLTVRVNRRPAASKLDAKAN